MVRQGLGMPAICHRGSVTAKTPRDQRRRRFDRSADGRAAAPPSPATLPDLGSACVASACRTRQGRLTRGAAGARRGGMAAASSSCSCSLSTNHSVAWWRGCRSHERRASSMAVTRFGKSDWLLIPSGVFCVALLFADWSRAGRRVAAAWIEVGQSHWPFSSSPSLSPGSSSTSSSGRSAVTADPFRRGRGFQPQLPFVRLCACQLSLGPRDHGLGGAGRDRPDLPRPVRR